MKTLVIGASTNPSRYSNMVTLKLAQKGYDVYPLGRKVGKIGEKDILTGKPDLDDIHTITLYLDRGNQESMYDYILGLNPKRIIFNPGSENPELFNLAKEKGIYVEQACSLVMLNLGVF